MRRTMLMTAVSTLCLAGQTALACPFCKDAVSTAGGPTAGGGDFNTSIYLMLGGAFSAMGFVTWTIVKAARSADADGGGAERKMQSAE